MIYGIGTDIVLLDRIRRLHDTHGSRFARRVLGPDELIEYERRHGRGTEEIGRERAMRYVAKRFAAKEAFSKALGLGLRGPMTLLSLEVLNDARGKPVCRPRKALAEHLQQLNLQAHVSISDEKDSVVAFVILEKSHD